MLEIKDGGGGILLSDGLKEAANARRVSTVLCRGSQRMIHHPVVPLHTFQLNVFRKLFEKKKKGRRNGKDVLVNSKCYTPLETVYVRRFVHPSLWIFSFSEDSQHPDPSTNLREGG